MYVCVLCCFFKFFCVWYEKTQFIPELAKNGSAKFKMDTCMMVVCDGIYFLVLSWCGPGHHHPLCIGRHHLDRFDGILHTAPRVEEEVRNLVYKVTLGLTIGQEVLNF